MFAGAAKGHLAFRGYEGANSASTPRGASADDTTKAHRSSREHRKADLPIPVAGRDQQTIGRPLELLIAPSSPARRPAGWLPSELWLDILLLLQPSPFVLLRLASSLLLAGHAGFRLAQAARRPILLPWYGPCALEAQQKEVPLDAFAKRMGRAKSTRPDGKKLFDLAEGVWGNSHVAREEDGADAWQQYDYVLGAVLQRGTNLRLASAALRDDKRIVLAAVAKNGVALAYAGASLQDDFEVVWQAVGEFGPALKYASAKLRNDKRLVLRAIGQCGLALGSASWPLRQDAGIIAIALKNDSRAIVHLSEPLRKKYRFTVDTRI